MKLAPTKEITITRLLLILLLGLAYIPASNADWFDDLSNATKTAADKLFYPNGKPLPRIKDADLAGYLDHWALHQVTEPIHKSPLFFVEAGDKSKPTVILVHGLGEAASKDWLKVIPALEKDYHVYAIDLPGFGLSKGVYFKYSPAQYSKILEWFVSQYSNEKPIMIGHSMGAAVSLYFAATYPNQLKKLILADAAGIIERTTFVKHLADFGIDLSKLPESLHRTIARAENLSSQWVELTGSLYDPTTLIKDNETLRSLMLSKNGNINAALALIETDYGQLDYTKVVPTHFIWGEKDSVASTRAGKALTYILPRAQLHVIAGAGHVPMNTHTKRFNELLLSAIINEPLIVKEAGISDNKKSGHCKHDDQKYFSGHYDALIVENCKLVVLDNVVAQTLSISDSIVKINHSVLGSVNKPLNVYESAITATASTFKGTIKSDESRFDFVAVDLKSATEAFEVISPSLIILSLSRLNSSRYQGIAHGFYELEKGSLDLTLNQQLNQKLSRKDH